MNLWLIFKVLSTPIFLMSAGALLHGIITDLHVAWEYGCPYPWTAFVIYMYIRILAVIGAPAFVLIMWVYLV